MRQPNNAWIVSGCGVSFLCLTSESTLQWIDLILDKGGYPVIKEVLR